MLWAAWMLYVSAVTNEIFKKSLIFIVQEVLKIYWFTIPIACLFKIDLHVHGYGRLMALHGQFAPGYKIMVRTLTARPL